MSEFQNPAIFRSVLDSLHTGVYLVDREGTIVFWNDGAERITGYLREDVVGRYCRDKILAHDGECEAGLCSALCPLARTAVDGKIREAAVEMRHRAGHRIPVWLRAVPIRDESGVIVGAAESFDERVFAREVVHCESERPVHTCLDEVTGLALEEHTHSCVKEHIAAFAKESIPFSVLCIEIDRLEQFRTTYGWEAVVSILRVVCQTLKDTLRTSDFLGHWNQRRFLAVLPWCSTSELSEAAEHLRKMVGYSGIRWWGDQLHVTLSMGGATVRQTDTAESLVQRAENALKESLQERGTCAVITLERKPKLVEV
ncbi:MAG TPA: diguanylate cyclase [Terriglobia bacterium]|nr:diguanylate cyclase [Terriglobia bacterium]